MNLSYIMRWLPLSLILLTSSMTAQDITWKQIGATMTSVGFPVMAADSAGRVYIAPTNDQISWSDDLGVTWNPINGLPYLGAINSIHVASGNRLILGTDQGIFVSDDQGSSWNTWKSPSDAPIVNAFIASSGTLFAITGNFGVYRSDDEGATWTSALEDSYIQTIVEEHTGDLYLGIQDKGAYRSTDDGLTWSQTSLTDESVVSLAITTNGTLLAGLQMLEGKGRVLRSVDHGSSWTTTTLSDISFSILPLPNGVVMATAVNSGVYRSTDDGRTWSRVNTGLVDQRMFPIILHPGGYLFAIDVFGNLYRTEEPVLAPSSVGEASGDAGTVAVSASVADGELAVRFTSKAEGHARLVLWDVTGRVVLIRESDLLPVGQQVVRVDCSAFPSGAYLYRLITTDGEGDGKIVVSH